jgi:putative ABC transport system permease protein
MSSSRPKPPAWADRFLVWYCRADLLEEIQGDAYELFLRRAKDNKRKADLFFIWNVMRFFRLKNIRRSRNRFSSNTTSMLKSYLITGMRNMMRNLMTSSINFIGLSVALGCAVMIFILLDSYYNLDSMHDKGDRIYLVANHVRNGDEPVLWANSPSPAGAVLAENTAVEMTARVTRERGAVRVGETVFQERIWFADPDFMQMFSFAVLAGNRNALKENNQLILTSEMAIKYFGSSDPIGQAVSIKFNDGQKREFTVGAVTADIPANSSMYYDFILPMSVKEALEPGAVDDWQALNRVTFVLLRDHATTAQLAPSAKSIKETQRKTNPNWPIERIEFIPMADVAQRSQDMTGSISWGNASAAMVGFAVIATFLVLLGCFNYMNVAVASVSTRLKEIGIRKVIGGGKREIIHQFLVENMLLCALSLAAGTALAYFFLVPGFDALYPVKIAFEFSSFTTIVVFFGGLLIVVALISGSYPAIYVASFNPVMILKGKEKFGNKSLLSRILLGCQFTLSFTTMICCLVFVWAGHYFETIDWGYDHAENIAVPVLNHEQYKELRDRAEQQPDILGVAGAESQIGYSNGLVAIQHGTQMHNVVHFPVGFNLLETNNVRLKAGRFFDEAIASDPKEGAVINESFARLMGWTNPVGQSFKKDSTTYYVIGVAKNFHYQDFFAEVNPVVFTIVDEEKFNYLIVKAAPGRVAYVYDFLQQAWKNVAPDDPWRGFFQDDVFKGFFDSNRANNIVGYFISGIALLLACMGLYGLVSYNLTRRLKEFSVRKVFGASIFQIFRLMNRDYLWIVLISFAIGAPLGSYLINLLIQAAFPDPIPPSILPYLITGGLMIATVGLTIATQINRLRNESPTVTLRAE